MRSGGESNVARMHGRPVVVPLVDDEGSVHVHPHSVVGTRGEAVSPFGKINRSRPAGDEVVNVNWRTRTAAAPVKVNQRVGAGQVRSRGGHGRRAACACVPVFGRVAVAWRWGWGWRRRFAAQLDITHLGNSAAAVFLDALRR